MVVRTDCQPDLVPQINITCIVPNVNSVINITSGEGKIRHQLKNLIMPAPHVYRYCLSGHSNVLHTCGFNITSMLFRSAA